MGGTGVSQLLLLLAVVLIVGTTLLRTQRHLTRARKQMAWRPPSRYDETMRAEGTGTAYLPDQVAAWEVRMHETARDLAGQLDSKMRALGVLIEQANRAAARLERALEQTAHQPLESGREPRAASRPQAAPGDSVPVATGASQQHDSQATDPCGHIANRPAGSGGAALPIGQASTQAQMLRAAVDKAGRESGPAPTNHATGEHSEDLTTRRREEVYMLSDYGFPPLEIAHRVGIPVGEVELMLRLRAAG